ncbi:MAG TPA: shikimate kinase [Candidatus Thermoplasmatota archaeon]|nr:shikimate kinase [Candidatus Thermoplasmatota archaeon]
MKGPLAQRAFGRIGHGGAHAAVTILNATATGIGCALAIEGGIEATWRSLPGARTGPGLQVESATDPDLVQAIHASWPGGAGPCRVVTRGGFPPSRGLKTSSSAATAILRAAHDAFGLPATDGGIERLAVAANRRAGTTLTGAFDDQVAVTRGGCHLTDNTRHGILRSIPVPCPWVAVWVPAASIRKADARHLPAEGLREALAPLQALVEHGQLAQAMTRNGAIFTRFYAQHGLPVTEIPARVALAAGALGAGLSGTGPAVAALFERQVSLPMVAGGDWAWHRTVEARP